jgi:transcriptional regulator with XRE-family HTH domain
MEANEGQSVRQRVGPTVRAIREQRGLRLNARAIRLRLSLSHQSRIERGLTVPSYAVLARIADD